MNQSANEERVDWETADEALPFETPDSSQEEEEGDPPFPIEGGGRDSCDDSASRDSG